MTTPIQLGNVVLKLKDAVILYDNDLYKTKDLQVKECNGQDCYVLLNGDKVKAMCGDNYQDGDLLVLIKDSDCEIVKEYHDHWRSLAKGLIVHSDGTVNREAMTRVNSLLFRCWKDE
jgi:hypothetical protein